MSKWIEETDNGGMTFCNVFDGRFVERVVAGTEGAVSRKLTKGANEGKEVWEVTHAGVEGMITGGGVVVKEFGGKKVREIQIVIDGDLMIQLPMHLLSNFAKPLPSVDPLEAIKIRVYKAKSGKVGMEISQGGAKIDWFYTREDPNGLPAVTKDDIGDWDWRAHDGFLLKVVNDFFENIGEAQTDPQEDTDESEVPF